MSRTREPSEETKEEQQCRRKRTKAKGAWNSKERGFHGESGQSFQGCGKVKEDADWKEFIGLGNLQVICGQSLSQEIQ